jgi:hypothetical protein
MPCGTCLVEEHDDSTTMSKHAMAKPIINLLTKRPIPDKIPNY